MVHAAEDALDRMGALRHGAAVERGRPVQVDLSNWDLGGAPSEWVYRHADRLFRTVALLPGHAARPLPRLDDQQLADLPLDPSAGTTRLRDHLPELSEQWNPCTVRDVLDMASGVQCPEVGDPGAYLDPSHPFYQFEASLGWRDTGQVTTPACG